ncbi:MAG TPA: sulfatase [Bryobacteraceae bacterium]|nr:sulfatase [Bryobacteraceae bacterium]
MLTRRQLGSAVAASALPQARRQPNILLIVADDLGYGELGCQGNRQIPTPNIDSIARNGVRFTNGYVTAPVCSPSRAGLMTGRYQTRFGHELNAIGRKNLEPRVGLPLEQTTLAAELKRLGYATGLIGKWHLGGSAAYHPQRRGFDEFYGFLHEGHFYVPPDGKAVVSHLRAKEPPYDDANPILRGREPVIEGEYLTQALTREAVSFIRRQAARPFFLCLAYNAIHSPMQALPEYVRRFEQVGDVHRRVFAAMLASLDDGIASVLATVRELKLDQDTVVFFLSDNGGPTAELTSSNLPLRGGKGQLFEGGIRVPFLMQWKDRLPAGVVFDRPVISLDIFATAIAAAGGRASGDGAHLLPALAAGRAPHESLFWRYNRNGAIRSGNWKLVRQFERGGGEPRWQLFDLAADLSETRDLAADKADVARRLQEEWLAMNAQMKEPLWGRS